MVREAGDGRVTKKKAQVAAGAKPKDKMGARDVKLLIEQVKKGKFAGDHAKVVVAAFCEALECQLDARREADVWDIITNLCKGKVPKDAAVNNEPETK